MVEYIPLYKFIESLSNIFEFMANSKLTHLQGKELEKALKQIRVSSIRVKSKITTNCAETERNGFYEIYLLLDKEHTLPSQEIPIRIPMMVKEPEDDEDEEHDDSDSEDNESKEEVTTSEKPTDDTTLKKSIYYTNEPSGSKEPIGTIELDDDDDDLEDDGEDYITYLD